jgi:hypothetical protein
MIASKAGICPQLFEVVGIAVAHAASQTTSRLEK